jgi:hypothetical protein
MSELLPSGVAQRIPPFYAQESFAYPVVYAIFRHAASGWVWYATEYEPNERLFFGYVAGFEGEWGYFCLDEMEEIKAGGAIARVDPFEPQPFSVVGLISPPKAAG